MSAARHRWILSVALVTLWIYSGCATTSPEHAGQRELLSSAAQDCQRQYPFVVSYSFNRFNQMSWTYRQTATQAERDQFIGCYRDRVSELTKTAAASSEPTRGDQSAGTVTPVVPSDAWAGPPIWNIGDEWSYRWESARGSGTFVRRVVAEEMVDGIDCYVIASGRSFLYFRKSDRAYVMEKDGASITYRYTPPRQDVVWPLYVTRSWEQLYVQDQPQQRQTDNYLRIVRVEVKERITVPAGTFDAFRITQWNKWNGSIAWQYWVAPVARNVIREDTYFDYGVRKRELTALKLNQGQAMGSTTQRP